MVVAMDSHTHVLYSYHIGVLGHRGSKALDPVNVDKTNGLEKTFIACLYSNMLLHYKECITGAGMKHCTGARSTQPGGPSYHLAPHGPGCCFSPEDLAVVGKTRPQCIKVLYQTPGFT
jgi:hypothetical protein